jgi:chromosomal replication initiator protein
MNENNPFGRTITVLAQPLNNLLLPSPIAHPPHGEPVQLPRTPTPNGPANAAALWAGMAGLLEQRMSLFSYRGFIDPLQVRAWVPGPDGFEQLIIGAPSVFLRDWVRDHYQDVLAEVALAVAGRPMQVVLELDEGSEAPATVASASAPAPQPAPSSMATVRRLPMASERLRGRLQPRFTFDQLIVGAHNQVAVAAARSICESPGQRYTPLYVFGEGGTGKTHLLHAMGHELLLRHNTLRIVITTAEEWVNEYVRDVGDRQFDAFRSRFRQRCDVLIVDDVQFLAGKTASQDEFLHMFDSLLEDRKQVILAGDRYPQDINGLHDKLKSRFQWGLATDLRPPDVVSRRAILDHKAHERGCALPLDVADYLSTHLTHNVRELEGALTRLHAYAQVMQQPLTLEIARIQLQPMLQGRQTVTATAIMDVVAAYYGLRSKDLMGPLRQRQVTRARQVAMWLCRDRLSMSYPDIGRAFGDRDHSTVMVSVKKVSSLQQSDAGLAAVVAKLQRSLFGE